MNQPDTTLYKDGRFPHCDPHVLHAPGDCEICDEYAPQAQQRRIAARVNFTGQDKPGLAPCPADAARGFKQAHRWHGNSPKPKANAKCTRCQGPALALFGSVECLSMFCVAPGDLVT